MVSEFVRDNPSDISMVGMSAQFLCPWTLSVLDTKEVVSAADLTVLSYFSRAPQLHTVRASKSRYSLRDDCHLLSLLQVTPIA